MYDMNEVVYILIQKYFKMGSSQDMGCFRSGPYWKSKKFGTRNNKDIIRGLFGGIQAEKRSLFLTHTSAGITWVYTSRTIIVCVKGEKKIKH